MDELEYYIEESTRMGVVLYTVYRASQPIGSLMFNPKEDSEEIDILHDFIKRCNESDRKQKAEGSRIRFDERIGKESY